MMFKALAVDVDGTITDSSKRIEALGIDTLRQVEAAGLPVILATGNVLPIAHGLASFIGLSGPVVAETGGVVSYRRDIHVLEDGEESRRAFRHLQGRMSVQRLFTDNWRVSEVALMPDADAEVVAEELRDFDIRVEATGFAVHLLAPHHSKMNGVRKAAELLGIGTEEILAIGDSDNDISMLSGCGMGVALANASPAAKAAATLVTRGRHSQGVREALLQLGVIKE